MKKALSIILALALCLPGMSAFADVEGTVQGDIMLTSTTGGEEIAVEEATESEIVFDDIVADSMVGEAVYKLVRTGIISGYGDGTFRPNGNLTRAELCKMINLAFELNESATELEFSDVSKEDWYYSYVLVAVKAGYIKGFQDNTFRGDDPVTREQVCAIINRVTASKNMALMDIPLLEDIVDPISDWAVADVEKVVANFIMPVEAGGKFRATENITRAELALALDTFVIEREKFTVTFDSKGGSEVESQIVKDGSTATKPADPKRDGYKFGGWYSDSALKKAYDFATPVSDNITLYAKWTSTSGGGGGVNIPTTPVTPPAGDDDNTQVTTYYTVTFNSKGGSEVESQSIASGETVTQPADPEKANYLFTGWYKDYATTEPYDFSSAVLRTFTLYAGWEEDPEAINNQRLADLTIISEVMGETTFTNPDHEDAMEIILDTMTQVISDGQGGMILTDDYIKTTYAENLQQVEYICKHVMFEEDLDDFKAILTGEVLTEAQNRGYSMTLSESYTLYVALVGDIFDIE